MLTVASVEEGSTAPTAKPTVLAASAWSLLLNRRTRPAAVGAENTTVARFRSQLGLAMRALEIDLARLLRHNFTAFFSALGAGEDAF